MASIHYFITKEMALAPLPGPHSLCFLSNVRWPSLSLAINYYYKQH